MAIASTETLLSLDQYSEIMGIPPAHFHQAVCTDYPDVDSCHSIWYQYSWMSPGKASREELARAIVQAETMIAQLMSVWPAPKWLTEDTQPYPRQRMHQNSFVEYYPAMSTGRRKTVGTRWTHFIAGGRRAVASIAAGVTVTYPAAPHLGSGIASVSVAYVGTATANEIAVFPSTDTSPNKQIRHLEVTIASGVLMIRGRSAQFLLPTLWEDEALIDGDDSTQYLTTVNIYRVYNSAVDNAEAPVEFGWQVAGDIDLLKGYGTLQVWDARVGIVSPIPAVWNATTLEWDAKVFCPGDEPHTMQLYYRAGWPLDPQGRMSEPVARAVAALATALLSNPVCGCSQAEKMSVWWQSYPSKDEPTSYRQIECPWGARRGAYEAYRVLSTFWGSTGSIGL